MRTELDKMKFDNVQLNQQAADLVTERDSLLRRISAESRDELFSGGSPDSAAGAETISKAIRVSTTATMLIDSMIEESLQVTATPPPPSPMVYTEASSPSWCNSATTPGVVLDQILPYSPDTAAGGLDRARTDE